MPMTRQQASEYVAPTIPKQVAELMEIPADDISIVLIVLVHDKSPGVHFSMVSNVDARDISHPLKLAAIEAEGPPHATFNSRTQ